MANQPLTLEDILAGVNPGGQEKVASENARDYTPEDTQRAEVMARLDKVASNFSEDEIMKVAASAKLTGEIMSEIVIENVKQAMPSILAAALHKIAIGTSDAISGELTESQHNVTDANEMQIGEDRVGKSEAPQPNVEQFLYANKTEGAQAAGSKDPETHQGDPVSNQQGSTVNKMSALLKRAMGPEGMPGAGGMPGGEAAGGEASPEEMLMMLMQKQQSGQQLSPEEMQLLQALQAQGGGGGGMPVQASANNPAQRQAAIRQLLSNFGV